MEVWKCTTQLCCRRRRVPLLLLSCKAILQSAFIWQIISTTAIPDFLKMSQEICSRGIFHFFLKQEEKNGWRFLYSIQVCTVPLHLNSARESFPQRRQKSRRRYGYMRVAERLRATNGKSLR